MLHICFVLKKCNYIELMIITLLKNSASLK